MIVARLFFEAPLALMFVWLHFNDPGEGGLAAAGLNAGLFVLFAVQHSVMARGAVKRKLALLTGEAGTRFTFVVVSGSMLALVVFGWQPLAGDVWHLEGPAAWFATAAFAIAILGTVVSARYIDVSEFVGVRQLLRRRSRQRAAPPELSVRGPYAYCRHPQYVLMIIVFWTGPVMTWSRFELAAIATLYFLVGVILEERNLRAELGPSYDEYSANVPMWIPRLTPWYPPQHAAAAESV